MGQTFLVRNHLPSVMPSTPQPDVVATATVGGNLGRHSCDGGGGQDDESPSAACEDVPSPSFSSSPPALSSPPSPTLPTTCADRSDEYQDFLSEFGILSLPLHSSLDRRSVNRIESPGDDTLISFGSISPATDDDRVDSFLTTPDSDRLGKLSVRPGMTTTLLLNPGIEA